MNTGSSIHNKGLSGSHFDPSSKVQSNIKGEERYPVIPEAQNQLDLCIARLQEVVAFLEERLQSVLRQEPCISGGEEKCPTPPCRSVADRINIAILQTDGIVKRIENLNRLLEL